MQQRRTQTPVIILITITVISIIAVLYLFKELQSEKPDQLASKQKKETTIQKEDTTIDSDKGLEEIDNADTSYNATPEELVGHIKDIVIKANESGDITDLINIIGESNLTTKQIVRLQDLASNSELNLDKVTPFKLLNKKSNQWALNLEKQKKILLNSSKNSQGTWKINGINIPNAKKTEVKKAAKKKALKKKVTDIKTTKKKVSSAEQKLQLASLPILQFLQHIKQLDPHSASEFIDSEHVSYATLTGLCIIFEEGHYKLSEKKKLRNMFINKSAAGWVAQVQSTDNSKRAIITFSSKRKDILSPWKITEINLDKLLSNYANEFSQGDTYYVPLIKNLKGGDSLALYFDLDSEKLSVRTKKQLTIAANLLKSSADKKITISGYTDNLGSDDYNLQLSKKRADMVMKFLLSQGMKQEQFIILSYGKSQPRRPNTDDSGRRANRRAEITLDF